MQSFDCTKYNRYGFTAKGQDCANVETILCQLQPTLNKRNRTITADQIPLLNFGIFADRKRLEGKQIGSSGQFIFFGEPDLISPQHIQVKKIGVV